MIKRWIEHREYQQLRKDHMDEKKLRQAGIVILAGLVLLFAVGAMEKLFPEPKPVKAPSVVKVVPQKALDAERFATLVTMPVEQLSSEDLDFIGSKTGNPCYEPYVQLSHDDMVNAIKACEATR